MWIWETRFKSDEVDSKYSSHRSDTTPKVSHPALSFLVLLWTSAVKSVAEEGHFCCIKESQQQDQERLSLQSQEENAGHYFLARSCDSSQMTAVVATLCQTGRCGVSELQLRPVSSAPAAFALVASCALTESLLFLQSSQIDLIINGYPEQIQVFFISCQHLLGQTCESLAGKHGQRT